MVVVVVEVVVVVVIVVVVGIVVVDVVVVKVGVADVVVVGKSKLMILSMRVGFAVVVTSLGALVVVAPNRLLINPKNRTSSS